MKPARSYELYAAASELQNLRDTTTNTIVREALEDARCRVILRATDALIHEINLAKASA